MTELEFAQLLSNYDHETTPARLLDEAERQVATEQLNVEANEAKLGELDDASVYQLACSDDGGYFTIKQRVAKQTRKQIRLHPRIDGNKQVVLPRIEIESGQIVSRGHEWWAPEFAIGWALRPKLNEQLQHSIRRLDSAKRELERIETAIGNGQPVLDQVQLRTMRIIMADMRRLWAEKDKRNWRKHGF